MTVNSLFPPIFLHSISFLHIARMDHAILHFLTQKQSSPNRQRNSPHLLGLFLLVPDFPPANALYWFFGFANIRPLAISADTFPFAGRNHLFSDKIRKSLPGNFRIFFYPAKVQHFPVIFPNQFPCFTDAVFQIGTLLANNIFFYDNMQHGVVFDRIRDDLHMLGKFFAVSLPFKKGQAHSVVRPQFKPLLYHGSAFLSLFVNRRATAILIRSGITKGMTHHPKTVVKPIAPEVRAYTIINHAVPKA